MTTDEIQDWLDAGNHDRAWLADKLKSKKGSVDQWFSKGFPAWATQIITLMIETERAPDSLELRFNHSEWAEIKRAMQHAGYVDQFEFFRDAIIAYSKRLSKAPSPSNIAMMKVAEEGPEYGSKP